MKLYKLDSEGEMYLHAGDLYQHSIWTYNAMVEMFDSNGVYVQDLYLTQREKEVIALAALLHDIGKAGRKELFDHTHPKLHYDVIRNQDGSVANIIYYQDRQEHPHISFEYAAKSLIAKDDTHANEDYYIINKGTGTLSCFDMSQLYNQLGITIEEQKIIAILLGIHYEFGNYKHGKITAHTFLAILEDLAKAVGYNHGILDEQIVRLAIVIQAADVKGLTPVPAQATHIFPEGITCEPVHQPTKFDDAFKALGYTSQDSCCSSAPLGVQAMNHLITYFHDQYQHTEIQAIPVYS